MALSLEKLRKVLIKKNMKIKKIYYINHLCVYIEVENSLTAELLLIYIPSKYDIQYNNEYEGYKIQYVDLTNEDENESYNSLDENEDVVEDNYKEITLDNEVTKYTPNIQEKIESNYNAPVELNSTNSKEINNLINIMRQLKRLKFCVQNVDYKITIFYKDYLCSLHIDNSIDCYKITNFLEHKRKIIVTIDLEHFYKHLEKNLETDITCIRQGIYKILRKNQITNKNNLQKLLKLQLNMDINNVLILEKTSEYENNINNLNILLEKTIHAEKEKLFKIDEINKKYEKEEGIKGLHVDIEKSHILKKEESELNEIIGTKKEIINTIQLVKNNLENINLQVDQIYFDNTIMLHKVLRNFDELTKI